MPGVILRRVGPLSFMLGITNGQVFCHHINHLRIGITDVSPEEQDLRIGITDVSPEEQDIDEWSYYMYEPEVQTPSGSLDHEPQRREPPDLPDPAPRYPSRICRPLDSYESS